MDRINIKGNPTHDRASASLNSLINVVGKRPERCVCVCVDPVSDPQLTSNNKTNRIIGFGGDLYFRCTSEIQLISNPLPCTTQIENFERQRSEALLNTPERYQEAVSERLHAGLPVREGSRSSIPIGRGRSSSTIPMSRYSTSI
jgi:hypothetical protein